MATATWHYQQAEWLLEQSEQPSSTADGRKALSHDAHPDVIRAALVHATLALAAPPAIFTAAQEMTAAELQEIRQRLNDGLPGERSK